jgi:hypothetical protein
MSKSIQSICIPFTTKTDSYSEFSRCRKDKHSTKKAGIADKLDEMTKDEVAKALVLMQLLVVLLNQNNQNLRVLQLLQLFY